MDEDENPKQSGAIQKYVKAQMHPVQSRLPKSSIQIEFTLDYQGVQFIYELKICSFRCNAALLSSLSSSSAALDVACWLQIYMNFVQNSFASKLNEEFASCYSS